MLNIHKCQCGGTMYHLRCSDDRHGRGSREYLCGWCDRTLVVTETGAE